VELDVRTQERLSEPVEVAAYYVVAEALTNAAKHAHASLARIEADGVDGDLRPVRSLPVIAKCVYQSPGSGDGASPARRRRSCLDVAIRGQRDPFPTSSAFALTSSNDQRSNAAIIASRSDSRNRVRAVSARPVMRRRCQLMG
jgi:hypothetical protein